MFNSLHSDAFCLFYDAATKTVKALNGSGRSPAKLTLEHARSRGLTKNIPLTNINAVTVPGLCSTVRQQIVELNYSQVQRLHGWTLSSVLAAVLLPLRKSLNLRSSWQKKGKSMVSNICGQHSLSEVQRSRF